MFMPDVSDKSRKLSMVEALREGLREEMARDSSVIILGEDVATPNGWGGPFTVCLGLFEEFGSERVKNTPISEKAVIAASVGAAMMGLRPVCEVQYADFLFCAMDEIVNEAAKIRYMSGGQYKVPLVLRAPTGATTRGAQHAQSPEAFFMHVPGLKVVAPATPYDAKGLLKAAIRDDSPVLFFEHKLLYGSKNRREALGVDVTMDVPEQEYTLPIGKAAIRRKGRDVTIVSLLLTVHWALEAAKKLAGLGIEAEVIDLRSLLPWDKETVLTSVEKTGRLVITEEGTRTLGWGAEIAATVADEGLYYLDAPIKRLAAQDVPIPFAPNLEQAVIGGPDAIVTAVKGLVGY